MSGWFAIRDGRLYHDPHFLPAREADALFAYLQTEVVWKQETVHGRPLPRLNAWYADAGPIYRYSGVTHQGSGWPVELVELTQRLSAVAGCTFNSLLLNFYRDGRDSIGFHTDAEPELGLNPMVATLSLGVERDFILKHRISREKLSYRLGHGSLLIMGGSSQHHWLHGIPKTEEISSTRISLTYRRILAEVG